MVGLVLISLAFLTPVFGNLMIFWWVHLPSPAMHPSGPPQNSMTSSDAYEKPKGVTVASVFPGCSVAANCIACFFWGVVTYMWLRQGIFMCWKIICSMDVDKQHYDKYAIISYNMYIYNNISLGALPLEGLCILFLWVCPAVGGRKPP